jgi:acid phosphatase type 7
MDCFRCKTANTDTSKFCSACGAPLDLDGLVKAAVQSQLKDELNSRVKEQKVVTVEITDAVRERLLGWVKWLGIAATLITSALAVVGIKGVGDVWNRARDFEKITDEQMSRVKALVDRATKGAIDVTQLEQLITDKLAALDKEFQENVNRVQRASDEKLAALDKKLQENVGKLQEASNANRQELVNLSKRVGPGYQDFPLGPGQPPYHLALDSVLSSTDAARISETDKLVFQVTGNTGGVKNPAPQQLVAEAMARAFATNSPRDRPAFLYLLGNIVYYNGLTSEYYPQFYQPYSNYPAPIFAIPGNHDGDPLTFPDGPQPFEPSLLAYRRNFCAAAPTITPEAGDSTRKAMTEPNSFWTLTTKFATIIGLYTNVPIGGALKDDQINWLVSELKSAPDDRALIIAMHHSLYSVDAHHSGSPFLAEVFQDAFNQARRVPNLVFSAHGNLYQHFEVSVASGRKVPFLVIGTGGYWHLTRLAKVKAGDWDDGHKVQFVAGVDDRHGFMTLEVTKTTIKGQFTAVSQKKGVPTPSVQTADAFSYSAEPIILAADQKVELLSSTAGPANVDQY